MIHIEITESPDPNVKNSFRYFKNELYLGRVSGDLVINDPEVMSSHIMIEILDDQVLVHPQKEVEFYLIDGKRATSIRKIKPGQTIGFGKTVVKLIDFKLTEYPSKKDLLAKKLAHLVEENSPRLQAVDKLTKLMK